MKLPYHTKKLLPTFWAVFAACGLTCTMSTEPYYISGEGLEHLAAVSRFAVRLRRCLSSDHLVLTVTALALLFLLRYVQKFSFSAGTRITAGVFALGFAGMQVLGQSFTIAGAGMLFATGFLCFRTFLRLAGIFTPVYCAVCLLCRTLDGLSDTDAPHPALSRRQYLKSVAFVLLCWLPYLLLFFPGTSNADTSTQIAQFFGVQTWVNKMSSVRGEDIIFTNHFPFFSTLVYGSFIQIGLWLGSAAIGLALHSIMQMLWMACLFTGALFYLAHAGLPKRFLKPGLLFLAFFPFYPMFAICMLKDSAFSGFCLLVSLLLCEIVRTKGAVLRSSRFCVGLIPSSLLLMLFRSQGVYIMAVVSVCFLICFRRYWKRVTLSLLLPVLFFQFVWIQVILPACNVAPAGKQEMYGILFQQTARYVRDYPDEVTEEEKEAIDRVIDYDRLAEQYNGELSDDVKYMYRQDQEPDAMSGYLKAWWGMFLKHPSCYIEAVLINSYGYFYLPKEKDLFYFRYYNKSFWKGTRYLINPTFLSEDTVSSLSALQWLPRRIPLLGLLFTPACCSWIVIFFYLNAIRKKQYGYLPAGLIYLLSTGIFLICPANANIRYMLPLLFSLPFLIGLMLIPPKRFHAADLQQKPDE